MRLPSMLNWALLCLNTALAVALTSVLLLSPGGPNGHLVPHPLPDNVAALGMAVYYEMGPFVLLAGKGFPKTHEFALTLRDQSLSMSLTDAVWMDEPATYSASMGVGPDFSLSCDYSLIDGNPSVLKMMLSHRREGLLEWFTDLNVDGVFDLRGTRDEEHHLSRGYVLYQGNWQEILGGDKAPQQDELHKQLVDGTLVSFVKERGHWLTEEEK